jgi:2-phosphosulfolactate phosphatase
MIGAGAIIHYLKGTRSPEAEAAERVFLGFQDQLEMILMECGSGKELIDKGFIDDVRLATDLNISSSAPFLFEGAYSHQRV